jgi:aryl-alcohol dehydrogenase-like predicted oxidoreductase
MSPARLALAFVYRRWFVASTIIGATTMAQLREDLDAWEDPPTDEAMARIEAIHLRHFNPAP